MRALLLLLLSLPVMATEPSYYWALGTTQCIEPETWTEVEWIQTPQNSTPMTLEGNRWYSPPRREGYFGNLIVTVTWDDASGPPRPYKRQLRIMAESDGNKFTGAIESGYHIPVDVPYSERFSAQTAVIQPGVWPDQEAWHWAEVWHSANEPVCISRMDGWENVMASPLWMYTDISRFQ